MLTHFSAMLIFALCIAVVFGVTQRAVPKMMIRFGAFTVGALVLLVISASWIMYLIKR